MNSQSLNIKETLSYIETLHSEYERDHLNQNFKYELDSNGYLIQSHYLDGKITNRTSVGIKDIKGLKASISYGHEGTSSIIKIKCKYSNCISYKYRQNSTTNFKNELTLAINEEDQAQKLLKAFNYLFSKTLEINNEKDKGGHFSSLKKEIKLRQINDEYSINVNIRNINNYFVLDSNASETIISNELEKKLFNNGTIRKRNYLADGLYRIADGSIINYRRLLIKKISVGGIIINNLVVSVRDSKKPLLLGINFLNKFGTWSIDDVEDTLQLNH